jgi:hypothetical protein
MLSAMTAAQATNTSARAAPVPADILESAEQSGSLFSIAQMDNNPFFTGKHVEIIMQMWIFNLGICLSLG